MPDPDDPKSDRQTRLHSNRTEEHADKDQKAPPPPPKESGGSAPSHDD